MKIFAASGSATAEPERVPPVTSYAFEVLSDPALITDPRGLPIAANSAYRALAREAGAADGSERPATLDQVLGAYAGLSTVVFRLNRAVRKGEHGRERLPAAPFGATGRLAAFDIEAAPLPGGCAFWRVRDGIDALATAAASAETPVASEGLLDEAPIGFFSATPEGRVVYMNTTLRAWLGAPEDVSAVKVKDFVTGDVGRILGRGRRPGGPPARADVVLKARDGIETPAVIVTSWPASQERPTSRSVVYALAGTGAPVGVAQALAAPPPGEPGGTLDAMFANAPFGVARLDGGDPVSAVIIDANPALLELTDGAAAPGASFASLFHIEDPETRQRFEAAKAGPADPLELPLARALPHASAPAGVEEDERHVHLYFAPDRGGRKVAYVVDVSGQKSLERQLFQGRKLQAVGQLAGGIAHDMNNLLGTMKLAVGLLLEAHPPGNPSFDNLAKLKANVNRAGNLVGYLLAFSRRSTVKIKPMSLDAAMLDFTVLMQQLLPETIKLKVEAGRELPIIEGDRNALEMALMNLVTNARDAMKKQGGGVLTIRTARASHEDLAPYRLDEVKEGAYAVIEVADTGCGMTPEVLERIFEPFFTTKPEGEGTGLGLAAVFGVVRQHGGQVVADSQPGQGSTFKVFLPAYEASSEEIAEIARAAAPKAPKPRDMSGRERVLFVEDETQMRELASLYVRRAGYELIPACDGEEGLRLVMGADEPVHLIVTDVVMPIMDGPTMVKELRKKLGDVLVIYTSGYPKEQFADLLGDDPAARFLQKPYSGPELLALIRETLAR